MPLRSMFFQAIVEQSPVPTFLKDTNSVFVYINDVASKLFQIEKADFIGKTDEDFFPPDQAEFFRSIDREVL